MGWWRSEHGIIGDWTADILCEALKKIESVYEHECHRKPKQGEIANLIEFCSRGLLRPTCGNFREVFNKEDAEP